MDEIRYLVSSGGTVSLYHASMAPPTEQCTHRTMLLPVYRGAHVHGIGLPNTREWVSTRLACGISGCSTRHLIRSTSGMTMPWSALYGHPASGIRPSMHNGLWPLCMVCACCSVSIATAGSLTPRVSVRSAMPHGPCPRGHVHGGWHRCIASCYRASMDHV